MQLPPIGLGTYQMKGALCEKTVQQALELGYRLIDTADFYGNQTAIGRAIRSWPREDLFLVSKIWVTDLSSKKIKEVIPRILEELQVESLDLLLIHWPCIEVPFAESLNAMLSFKEVKTVGVSNFVRQHLKEISSFPIKANQFEVNPYLQRKTLVNACKKQNIQVIAHRPLDRGKANLDPVLKSLGAKYGKSATQVTLRWHHQRQIIPIPKASSLTHLKENLDIFDFSLDGEEMRLIESLDTRARYAIPEGFPYYED